jgi:hypothetical protein
VKLGVGNLKGEVADGFVQVVDRQAWESGEGSSKSSIVILSAEAESHQAPMQLS